MESQEISAGVAQSQKRIDLDDVLVNELGQFGRFQLNNILLVSIPIIMSAFMSEYIFSAAAIPHRCKIPECGEENKGLTYDQPWANLSVPMITNVITGNVEQLASCERFSPTGGNGSLDSCPPTLFNRDATESCEGFVYARDNTVVYEFDLGCQEWIRALAGTLASVGSLLVLPITGYVSDRFGRKIALVISLFNEGVFGLIRAFSINYTMYLAFQIIQVTFAGGSYSSAYILASEMVGPKYRVLTSAVCASMFSVGTIILGGVAWLVQPWRYMIMTLFIPCFLIISYYWILSESVRWLLSKKKYEEARKVLDKVARVNKKVLGDKSLYAQMMNTLQTQEKCTKEKQSLIPTIIKSKVLLRRVCTTPVWWITATFVFYGLTINSTSLSDTMYLNFMLTAAIEIPGFFSAILLLDRIGRRTTLSIGYFSSAICNIAFAFIPRDMTVLRPIIYLLGKFGISLVMTSLYLFTSELYPTEYRHSLLAFSSMIGRIGSIIAPLTPALMSYWTGIPSIMFGTMGLISGVLVLTQPETLGTKMPDTLAEAEALGRPDPTLETS